jgi:hypothetical protein
MGPPVGLFPLFLEVFTLRDLREVPVPATPLVAPVENVSLPNGSFLRGISMSIGSNNPNISFFTSR